MKSLAIECVVCLFNTKCTVENATVGSAFEITISHVFYHLIFYIQYPTWMETFKQISPIKRLNRLSAIKIQSIIMIHSMIANIEAHAIEFYVNEMETLNI
jgi:hypothetical protein